MATYRSTFEFNVGGNAETRLKSLKELRNELEKNVDFKFSINDTAADSSMSRIAKRKRELGKTTTSKVKFEATGLAGVQERMSRINGGFKQVSSSAAGLRSALGKVAVAGGTVGAGLLAMGVKGAKAAVDLQSSYKTTENLIVTGGESAKQSIKAVSEMQKDGKKYSLEYGQSQQSIADAYQDLVKRGHTSSEALAVMKTELQGSVASGDDFKDVVSVSSQTIEAFGMKTNNTAKMVKNTKEVVNDLAYAADATATDFSDLGVGMSYVGSSAHVAGISLSDTAAAMGELSNNGLEADKAGTGLRKVINSITSPTKSAESALKSIGLSMDDFKTKSGKLKSLPEIFETLNGKMGKLSKTKQLNLLTKIFGTTGQQAAAILEQNADALDKLSKKVEDSAKNNYVEKLAKKNADTVKMQMAEAKQAVNAFGIEVGTAFLPAFTTMSQTLAKGLQSDKAQKDLKELSDQMETFGNDVAKYLVAHGDDLLTIAESVGKIGTAIGKGAWDTLATFFSVISGNGLKDGGDATKTLANALKSISDHQTGLKVVGGILATYFVASKLAGAATAIDGIYRGLVSITTLGSLKSGGLLSDLGKLAGKAGIKFKMSPELDKSATTRVGRYGRELGETAGSNASSGVLSKIGQGGSGILRAVGKIAIPLAFAYDIYSTVNDIHDAFTSGSSKKKFEAAGQTIGTATGGAIGAWFGGPQGAMLGATIGGFIGKYVSSGISDAVKTINAKDIQGVSIGGKGDKSYSSYEASQAGISKNDSTLTRLGKGIAWGVSNEGMAANAKILMTSIGKIFSDDSGWKKAIGKSMGDVGTSFSKEVLSLSKSLGKKGSRITKSITGWFSDVGKWLLKDKSTTQNVSKWSQNLTKSVDTKKKKGGVTDTITKWFSDVGTWLKKDKSTSKQADTWTDNLVKAMSTKKKKGGVTQTVTGWFSDIGSWLKKDKTGSSSASTWMENVTNSLSKNFDGWKKGFSKDWSQHWSQIADRMGDFMDEARGHATDFGSGMSKWWGGFSKSFSKSWNSLWSSVRDFFGSIWGDIKNSAHTGMSGVASVINTGIGGINNVISFFGGKKHTIPTIKGYAHGTGYHAGGPAVLNDEKGVSDPRELVETPDGKGHMFSGSNVLVPDLPAGARVYTARETAQIMSNMGISHYADGKDGSSNFFEQFIDKAADIGSDWEKKLKEIADYVAHPVEAVTKIFDKNAHFEASGIGDFGYDSGHYLIKAGKDWFKGLFSALKDGLNLSNPPGSGVERWRSVISAAANAMGVSLSGGQINKLLKQIQTESNGDPTVKQKVKDINSASGHPAQGLLQFIPSTFAHWALPGHKQILNGADQIMAAINALNHGGEGGWGNIGNGHGWETGGHVFAEEWAKLAEDGDEYVINPRKPNALNLIKQALKGTVAQQPTIKANLTQPQASTVNTSYRSIQAPSAATADDGSSVTSLLSTLVSNTEKLVKKDNDVYMDGQKVTKRVNKLSRDDMNALGAQLGLS